MRYCLFLSLGVVTFVLLVLMYIVEQLRAVQKAILSVDKYLEDFEPEKAEFVAEVRLIKCYSEIRHILRFNIVYSKFNFLFHTFQNGEIIGFQLQRSSSDPIFWLCCNELHADVHCAFGKVHFVSKGMCQKFNVSFLRYFYEEKFVYTFFANVPKQ